MTMASDPFTSWIEQLPKWHGWLQLSVERAYMHAEEEYDQQYGVTTTIPEEGEGLCNLLKTHQVDTSGPALEIGCGTGYLSFGLAKHYPGPDILITDPSPAFLRLTQSLFDDQAGFSARRHYGVFNADDMDQLPPDMFSVIALRSTLHHILRVEDFIAACARTLRPGGALVMSAEPCESGYLLMATFARFIPTALKAAGIEMRPEWTRQLNEFTDAVKFYCLRDIDKAAAEDKHLFDPHELAELGAAHGLHLRFFPTATFWDFAPPYARNFRGFTEFFFIYLQNCMRFDAEFVELIRVHLKDQLKYIDDCYRSHPGPAITGVFLLKKSAVKAT